MTTHREYDSANRLRLIESRTNGVAVCSFTYDYNLAGQRTRMVNRTDTFSSAPGPRSDGSILKKCWNERTLDTRSGSGSETFPTWCPHALAARAVAHPRSAASR